MFARSVGKRLAVGAATLATGFGLMLSIAPAASACPVSAPWGPWNGLGYEQPVASGLPFHFHHCAPLAEQAPELTAVTPLGAPLVETRPQWRPASEHSVRHRARRHHIRHHRHARHHGRRFHNGRVYGARYGHGSTVHRSVVAPMSARLAPARALSVHYPLAQHLGRHHGFRHHHRHHRPGHHHRRHHHI